MRSAVSHEIIRKDDGERENDKWADEANNYIGGNERNATGTAGRSLSVDTGQ